MRIWRRTNDNAAQFFGDETAGYASAWGISSVGEDEAKCDTRADGGGWEQIWVSCEEEVREFTEGAVGPGVDLDVLREALVWRELLEAGQVSVRQANQDI